MLTSADVHAASFTVTRFREGYDRDEVSALLASAAAALAAWEDGSGVPELSGHDIESTRFRPTKFDNGFDQDEVDDFLDRIAAALREHAVARLASPAAVVAAEPGVPGVPVEPLVPAAPVESAATVEPAALEPQPVAVEAAGLEPEAAEPQLEAAEFEPAALKPAEFEPAERPAVLRSSAIADATFTTVRFGHGFSMAGVDGFLAAAREVIAGYERPSMLAAPPALSSADVVNVRFTPTWWRAGYDQDDVAAYLTRVIATLDFYERR